MNLALLSEQEKNIYHDFVAAHPGGSFLQSWDWGDWQEQLGHKVYRYAVEENGKIIVAAQVIEMNLANLNQHYLYLPYGPLVSEDNKPTLRFFLNELINKHPRALFIRFEPKQNLTLPADFKQRVTARIQPGKTLLLDLRMSEENLLAKMHPKTRYNIKVALRHGVTVEPTFVATPGHGLNLKEALDLIIDTAKRQDFRAHRRDYYQQFIDFFALQPHRELKLSVYKGLWRGQILAAAIMIDFGSTRTYLFGGSSQEHRNVMAPYLLHWQAISDAAGRGLKHYDFWGAETSAGKISGFVRFKEGFGGATITYPETTDIILRPLWYTIYTFTRTLNRLIG